MPSPRKTTKYSGILERTRNGTFYFHVSGKYYGGYVDIEVAREDRQWKCMIRDISMEARLRVDRLSKALKLGIIVDDKFEYILKETTFYIDSDGYPSTTKNGKHIKLHQLVYGPVKQGYVIDHINGHKLLNTEDNLREVTWAQNTYNRKLSKKNTTGYTGVSFCKKMGNYKAAIMHQGKFIHLGYHDKAECAGQAYTDKEKELRGDYVRS